MKVLLVANYANDQQRSMLGFARVLEEQLKTRGLSVRYIAPHAVFGRLLGSQPANAGLRKWLGYIDKFLLFPRQLKRAAAQVDVVHICDHGNSPYNGFIDDTPHIVTCHDLLATQAARGEIAGWEVGPTGRFMQKLIIKGLQNAHFVVCVSQNTQNELQRIVQVPTSKSKVIYNGFYQSYERLEDNESRKALVEMNLPGSKSFLLHVGGNQPYKNRLGVLKIFKALCQRDPGHNMHLVMAGKPWTPQMKRFVADSDLTQAIVEIANPNAQQLRALYSQSRALLFPSLFEGFGLPIIEAQACGCPVFTSNRAPMSEVAGNAAFYFDPEDPEQAAQVILSNIENVQDVVQQGFKNIERFSTERMINEYIDVYKQVSARS